MVDLLCYAICIKITECGTMESKITKWNKGKCIEELKRLYEEHGILNATTIHKYRGGMAKYIEREFGSLSMFCSDNNIGYLFKSRKNNWTERKAVETLKRIYKEKGRAISTTELMTENSGLERYLRTKKDGVRKFCEKKNISFVIANSKKQNWTPETASETVKSLYKEYKESVGYKLLNSSGYGGLYQWAGKKYGSYKEFIFQNKLTEYTSWIGYT
jgi:hypothetical protein